MTDEADRGDEPQILRVLQSRSETRAFYDKISRVYDLLAERSEAPVRRQGLDMLGAVAGQSVLEVGCGTGASLVELANAVGTAGRATGIDLSGGMLGQARRRVQRDGVSERIGLVCGDACRMPFRSSTLDAVFMSFTLELFDTPQIPEVLAECRRLLRPDGRLVVVGMSKEGDQGFAVHAFEWTHRHFPNFLDCRPIYVRRALEQAGFRVREVRREQMWIPVEIVLASCPATSKHG